jgi:hypothetical protein
LKTKEKDFKGKYQFDKEKNEFTNNVAIFIVKIFTPLN